MAEQGRRDPIQVFKFQVLGFSEISFSQVSGLEEESEVATYREGTDPITPRKLPGLTSYPNLVLQHGISDSMEIVNWRAEVAAYFGMGDGIPEGFRREVTIELYGKGSQSAKRRWVVHRAWPSKLTVGEMNASSSDVLIETLELAHEGLEHLL